MHTLGYWWAIAGLDYYTDYVEGLRERDAGDVHAFARRTFVETARASPASWSHPRHRAQLGTLAGGR